MGNEELKTLLASGATSIVFDTRPNKRGAKAPAPEGAFFELARLKNAIVLKTGTGQGGLKTHLFLPFDNTQAMRGGISLECQGSMSVSDLNRFFDSRLETAQCGQDLRKLEILAKTPSFSPFLLRDAFERSGIKTDPRHFAVSESEAKSLTDMLKGKLKPLATLALVGSSTEVGDTSLGLLVRKLWELNDQKFLSQMARALRVPETDIGEVLYAWIGVCYFHQEFTRLQPSLKAFAEWLVSKTLLPTGAREEAIAEFDALRVPIRERVRSAWAVVGSIFINFHSAYDRLINGGDPALFVSYLKNVREDFYTLGLQMAFIQHGLCIFDAIAQKPRGSQVGQNLLHELCISMRGGNDLVAVA